MSRVDDKESEVPLELAAAHPVENCLRIFVGEAYVAEIPLLRFKETFSSVSKEVCTLTVDDGNISSVSHFAFDNAGECNLLNAGGAGDPALGKPRSPGRPR